MPMHKVEPKPRAKNSSLLLYNMKSLRCSGRQFLTLHPAGFDKSTEYCGGYAGLSHNSGVAPKVANATYV
jgi:hypothetical protein